MDSHIFWSPSDYVDVWERDSRTLRAGLVVKQSQTIVVEATKKKKWALTRKDLNQDHVQRMI